MSIKIPQNFYTFPKAQNKFLATPLSIKHASIVQEIVQKHAALNFAHAKQRN